VRRVALEGLDRLSLDDPAPPPPTVTSGPQGKLRVTADLPPSGLKQVIPNQPPGLSAAVPDGKVLREELRDSELDVGKRDRCDLQLPPEVQRRFVDSCLE